MSQNSKIVLQTSLFNGFVIRLHNLCNIFIEPKIVIIKLCNIVLL